MIPELIGRLPIIATLNQLSEEDLARILTEPKDALTKQYQVLFHYDDARLKFSDGPSEKSPAGPRRGDRSTCPAVDHGKPDARHHVRPAERQRGQTYTVTDKSSVERSRCSARKQRDCGMFCGVPSRFVSPEAAKTLPGASWCGHFRGCGGPRNEFLSDFAYCSA